MPTPTPKPKPHHRQGPMLIAPLPRESTSGVEVWEVSLDGIQFTITKEQGEYGDTLDQRKIVARKNQWAGGKQIGGAKIAANLDEALLACWNFNWRNPWPK
jgi:hypothetical protein